MSHDHSRVSVPVQVHEAAQRSKQRRRYRAEAFCVEGPVVLEAEIGRECRHAHGALETHIGGELPGESINSCDRFRIADVTICVHHQFDWREHPGSELVAEDFEPLPTLVALPELVDVHRPLLEPDRRQGEGAEDQQAG